jgi:hypothetical protein
MAAQPDRILAGVLLQPSVLYKGGKSKLCLMAANKQNKQQTSKQTNKQAHPPLLCVRFDAVRCVSVMPCVLTLFACTDQHGRAIMVEVELAGRKPLPY